MSSQILAEDVGFRQQDEIDRLEINVQRRLNGRVRDFRLLVHPDGLILQGSTATFHAKQLAQGLFPKKGPSETLGNRVTHASAAGKLDHMDWRVAYGSACHRKVWAPGEER